MKYVVVRISDTMEKPCAEAKYTKLQVKICGSIKDDYFWTIELKDLESLDNFIKKYGRVIIGDDFWVENIIDKTYQSLIIYDDYIE